MLYWSAKALEQWVTVLPRSLREEVANQVERAREVWRGDREEGRPGVWLPGALARKFRRAAESFECFWLFPARQISVDPATRGYAGASPEAGIPRRHHLLGKVYNEAIKRAAQAAGIEKQVTSHVLRIPELPSSNPIDPGLSLPEKTNVRVGVWVMTSGFQAISAIQPQMRVLRIHTSHDFLRGGDADPV